MGRNISPRRSLSPILRMELENLDKDSESRKSALKALKSYVKDLDYKAIPMFLAQVSETKQTGISSNEHTISLYEVLARVHGPKIVPQINNIMSTIVKTLSSCAGAFALHQACSKVVPAIARYAMDPTTAKDEKKYVIQSICKPLSDCLLDSQENLSSGAALCLKALVECDNWRFASNEMVNEVCQKVAGALEKHSQTNSHMALVTALAKHNSLTVEAYARLLIQSGLRILDEGFEEVNSQKQLSSIHMVTSLMRCLDPKSILSEMELVTKEMEKCQFDRMPFVSGAAFEALQIAKKIILEKGSKFERDMSSPNSSSFDGRLRTRHNESSSGDQSPFTTSPESQTIESFFCGYGSFIESPVSMNGGTDYGSRSVNRKLWRSSENGGVNISLKDGIFSELARGSNLMGSEYEEFSENHMVENFAGFVQKSPSNGFLRSNTPSPQRSNSHINVDEVKIFSTPRKLIRSLQDLDDNSSRFSVKRRGNVTPSRYVSTPTSKHVQNDNLSQDLNHNDNKTLASGDEEFLGSSESVSSTEDVLTTEEESLPVSIEIPENKSRILNIYSILRTVIRLLIALVAVAVCLMAFGDRDDLSNLVPT